MFNWNDRKRRLCKPLKQKQIRHKNVVIFFQPTLLLKYHHASSKDWILIIDEEQVSRDFEKNKKVKIVIFLWISSIQNTLSLSNLSTGWNVSLTRLREGEVRLCFLGEQHTWGQRETAQSWGLVYSSAGKKTGRRKWGLTVSWSTIGWWKIQCDWAELGDDPYSMQNSHSNLSVPTSP